MNTSWWMVLSDPETYEPKAIYKEIKNRESIESFLYDSAFLKIAAQLDFPIFKFVYSETSNNILSYKNLRTGEEILNMNLGRFLKIYTSFI